MKKTKKRGLGRTICLGVLIVMMTVMFSTASKSYAMSLDVAETELNNISKWKSGYLDEATATETAHKRRIYTANYYDLNSDEYDVSLSTKDYTITAFYYDANKKYLRCEKLYDGSKIEVNDGEKFVRFDLRKNIGEKVLSPGQWGRRLGVEVVIGIKAVVRHESYEINLSYADTQESHELFEDMIITSQRGWKSGDYSSTTGEQIENKRRLVTKECFPVYKQTLQVSINFDYCRIGISEYDENMNYIRRTDAENGDEITVSDETRFVGFTIFRITKEKTMSPGQWGREYAAGLKISVSADETGSSIERNAFDSMVPSKAVVSSYASYAITTSKVKNTTPSCFYDEIKNMFFSGDKTVHDISKYHITIADAYADYYRLIKEEGFWYYEATVGVTIGNFNTKDGVCQTVQLVGLDDDFLDRYNKMMARVTEIKSMITPEMRDLDKVLLVHDYLAENATYNKKSFACASSGGILGEGRGMCSGFAFAYIAVMKELGIEAEFVSSSAMNHSWCLVKIEGNYYHVDVTWDNTAMAKEGYMTHSYLMASDDRFAKAIPSKHYDWIPARNYESQYPKISANSTKFDNWFVHDVHGKMLYSNGYWYYSDGKTLVKSDVYGNNKSIVLTENAEVCIISMSQGRLQYKVNGVVKSVNVK